MEHICYDVLDNFNFKTDFVCTLLLVSQKM